MTAAAASYTMAMSEQLLGHFASATAIAVDIHHVSFPSNCSLI